MADPRLLELALAYRDEGMCVIPAIPGDKMPALSEWKEYQTRLSTYEEIRRWWSPNSPNYNIGVVTGKISGIVVIDVDDNSVLPPLIQYRSWRTVDTGTPGHSHLYYRYPSYASQVPNRVRFLKGIDVRGDGGFAIMPGSVHKSGKRYQWGMTGDMPELPTYFYDLMTGKIRNTEQVTWVSDLLDKGSPKGQRDDDATRLAGYFASMKIPQDLAITIMGGWYAKTDHDGFTWEQALKCVHSVYTREAAKPVSKGTAPVSGYLNTFAFSEYLTADSRIKWMVQDWLPQASMGLMVAPPGSYKTWIMLYLCMSVATGLPFLGKYPVKKKQPVLVVQVEDGHAILRKRLKQITADIFKYAEFGMETIVPDEEWTLTLPPIPDMDIFKIDSFPSFEDPEFMKALDERLAFRKYGLVAFDPLYTLVSMTDYMQEAAQAMLPLKALRDKYGTSFLVLHHTRKSSDSADDGGEREASWGSQFINAWLEQGFQLRKSKKDNNDKVVTVYRFSKMVGKMPPLKLTFDINTTADNEDEHLFSVSVVDTLMGDDTSATSGDADPSVIPQTPDVATADIRAISRLLQERQGTIRNGDISEMLGMPKATVTKRLKKMVSDNMVVKNADGSYSWAG